VSRARRVLFLGAMLALLAIPASAPAQQPEIRVDVLGPAPYSVQPGLGAIVPLGYYVRVSADVGYAPRSSASLIEEHWRADLFTRVTLDPFRQQRWALSIGGGLSVRRHTYLAAIADVEGPEMHGVLPAFQLGLCGGVRAAVIFRGAVMDRR
jgi:hypothetical protein